MRRCMDIHSSFRTPVGIERLEMFQFARIAVVSARETAVGCGRRSIDKSHAGGERPERQVAREFKIIATQVVGIGFSGRRAGAQMEYEIKFAERILGERRQEFSWREVI